MIPPILITIFGAVLRFTNLNWDMGGRLHPDEALIVNGALTIKFFTNLFPGFHDYNGLSVYLLKITSFLVSFVTGSGYWSAAAEGVTIVGRFLSALLATISILLLYQLAKRLWNGTVAVFASLLFAASPLLIQLAHFYTSESIMVFLLILLLISVTRFFEKPTVWSAALMALPAGLLLATKNTSYLFVPIPIAAVILRKPKKSLSLSLIFVLCTLILFFLSSPYSFLDFSGYLTRSQYLADVVSGRLLMDWTLQFLHTTPLFWIPNLLYAFGGMVLVGVGGGLQLLTHKPLRKNLLPVIFAGWMIGYLVFIAFTYLKFIRYSAPLAPFLSLFAAKLLWDIRKPFWGKCIVGIVITSQLLWAIMFFHVYTAPNTSLQAADWIASHVPDHAVLLTEDWNSIIHFDTLSLTKKQLGFLSFNAYSSDTEDKLSDIQFKTREADYIIIESPKVVHTIDHLPDRNARTAQWYMRLENGSLGYTKVAQFSSYPQLGPFTINDESAEETWYAFDHPTVRIYKRNGVCAPGMACR